MRPDEEFAIRERIHRMDTAQRGPHMPMRLGPGPVFVYEWLTATRRWQLYALRVLFVGAILVGLAFVWYQMAHRHRGVRETASLAELADYGEVDLLDDRRGSS